MTKHFFINSRVLPSESSCLVEAAASFADIASVGPEAAAPVGSLPVVGIAVAVADLEEASLGRCRRVDTVAVASLLGVAAADSMLAAVAGPEGRKAAAQAGPGLTWRYVVA